jgi:hypothetical protein
MKYGQCLTGELRLRAISEGVDVKKLDEEFKIVGYYTDLAEKNLRKKRGWLKNFIIVFAENFPIPRLGYVNKEEEEEYERLMKLEGNEKLHKLRPDIY